MCCRRVAVVSAREEEAGVGRDEHEAEGGRRRHGHADAFRGAGASSVVYKGLIDVATVRLWEKRFSLLPKRIFCI